MFKNTSGQKIRVFAFDSATNLPKTGDAANLTAYVSKDFGAITALTDTSATEEDATNGKGYYLFDASQAETNADDIAVTAKSATAGIVVIGAPARITTLPPNFGATAIDSSGKLLLQGTQTGVTIPTVTTLTSAPSDSSGVTTLLGKFTGITLLAQWLGLLAGKQTGNSTARTELRATGGGSGTFDETTDALEALRDRGDAAWVTGGAAAAGHDVLPPEMRLYNTLLVTGTSAVRKALTKVGGNQALAADWTPAAGDVKLSKDGGAEANITNLPTFVNGRWEFIFTAAELSCRILTVRIADSATKVIVDADFEIYTFGDVTNAFFPDNMQATSGTAQTGDSYARLGAPAGASIAADVAAVKTDTGNLITRIPSALFSGITSLAQWLGAMAGKQTGNTTARTELRATGAGSGTFDETTDSQEALRDRGDAAWVGLDAAATRSALGLASPNLDAQLLGIKPLRSGTAQAGGATSLTLDAGASASNNFYNNDLVIIYAGTGAGQARFVTGYVGSTKVASMSAWVTNPDATSQFAVMPFDSVPGATAPTTAQIVTAIMTDLLSGTNYNTAASFGKLLKDSIDATISSRATTSAVAAQVTTDHGAGSYVRNTEPLDATATQVAAAAALNAYDAPTHAEMTAELATADDATLAAIGALPTAVQNADALLGRNAKGGSTGAANVSVAAALAGGFMKNSIASGVLTINYADGTPAFTRSLTRQQLDAIVSSN